MGDDNLTVVAPVSTTAQPVHIEERVQQLYQFVWDLNERLDVLELRIEDGLRRAFDAIGP